MKRKHVLTIIFFIIFVLVILSCRSNVNIINNESIKVENNYINYMTELNDLLNIDSYDEIDFSKKYIIKNKPYRIKHWPFHIFILESEKCFDGEEWHEVMTEFGGGVIVFGENFIIITEYYSKPNVYVLSIFDYNGNHYNQNGEKINSRIKIGTINEKIIIQYINEKNEIVKYIYEIEELL